jgi:hypothetical protein
VFSRQPTFGIDIEALHTDKAIAMNGTHKVRPAKELTQAFGLNEPSPAPTQHVHRCVAAIDTLAVGSVRCRIKEFDEIGMRGLRLV